MFQYSVKVTINRTGIDPLAFINNVPTKFYPEMQAELVSIAEKAVETMRSIISNSKVRPSLGTNFLENSITMKILKTHPAAVIIGVGDIDKMNKEAPYWSLIDAGGKVAGGKMDGRRVPVGAFGAGNAPNPLQFGIHQWIPGGVSDDGKQFSFIPLAPIEGKHYISITIQTVINDLEIRLKSFVNQEIQKTSKRGHYGYNIGGAR